MGADLDHYETEDGCGFDWGRLRSDLGFSASEAVLIDLAEDMVQGPLGRATGLDDRNWAAFLSALDILRRNLPKPRLAAA
jgi:hypothetical protein